MHWNRQVRRLALLLFVSPLAGCSTEGEEDTSGALAEIEAPRSDVAHLSDPEGRYALDVTAEGTGCLPGTWHAQMSEDARQIQLRFDAYSAELPPGAGSGSNADCALRLRFRSAIDMGFVVSWLEFNGRAALSRGVTARQHWSFHGWGGHAGSSGDTPVVTLTGPFRGTYHTERPPGVIDPVWSDCTRDVTLNLSTGIALRRPEKSRESGTMALSSALAMGVAARACTPRP